jgi:hypothetical protein
MLQIKKFLKDLFTGKDNKTWDLGRIMWFQGVLVYFTMTLYSLYQGIAIDPMNWATGFGALMAGSGAAMLLKQSSEPSGEATIEEEPTITTPPLPGKAKKQ